MKKDYHEKISVIMSTYNTHKEILLKSINSILNQSYKNIELIIVCDGICEDYNIISNIKDKRIVLVQNDRNYGLPYSLNKAIEISKGSFIARMDSDDVAKKNRLEIQYKFMIKHPNIDICGMEARRIGNGHGKISLYYNHENDINYQLIYESCFVHPTIMFRKSFLVKNNIKYNEEYRSAQDFELWSRINKNNMALIKKVGLYYRIHESQIGTEKKEEQAANAIKIIKRNVIKRYGNEKKIIDCFLVLSLRKKISTTEQILELSKNIDLILKKEKFDINKKRVLYTRFFHVLLKNNLLFNNIIFIIKNDNVRNKVLNLRNLFYVFYKIKNYL